MARVRTIPERVRSRAAGPRRHGSPRRSTVALLIALPFAGAMIAAGLNPLPADRYRAEAALTVHDTGGGDQVFAWRTLASALALPEVLHAAATVGGPPLTLDELRDRVQAAGDPRSGILRVRARADTQETAERMADAAAQQALTAMQRSARTNLAPSVTEVAFGFERMAAPWDTLGSTFNLPPVSVRSDSARAHTGRRSLRVRCDAPRSGCGPAVRLQASFRTGRAFLVAAWVRAARPARFRVLIGADPRHVAVGRTVRAGRGWTQLVARWAPAETFTSAELGVQLDEGAPATFWIDDVTVHDPATGPAPSPTGDVTAAQLDSARIRRSKLEDRFSSLSSAQPVDQASAHTGVWALGGALAGLLVALGALAAASLARRRAGQP